MYLDPQFLHSLGIVDFSYTEEDEALSFDRYEKWVHKKKHVPLHYLADHRKDIRKSLKIYFPPFQSVLTFLFSYTREKKNLNEFYQSSHSNQLKISSYALGFEGRDYHEVIRERLLSVKKKILKEYPHIKMTLSLDVHPILERDMAFRSGLGWVGKNSMLISRQHGSFTMIAGLLLSEKLPLKKRALETDHCGHCNACIEVCPTDAIDPKTRTLSTHKCLSTFTIELFQGDEPPPAGIEKGTGEIFGCDLCQDVCPWNHKPLEREKMEIIPFSGSLSQKMIQFFLKRPLRLIIKELESWSNKKFIREFRGTPLVRTGKKGLLRNLKSQIKNF